MKATGIVRRIDDLGRVVIPKEIRKNMGIQEGDPLEIYTEDRAKIVICKYSTDADTMASQAEEWLSRMAHRLSSYQVKFSMNTDTTTCEVIMGGKRRFGHATRNPGDKYNPNIGMVYAASRATGLDLPSDWQ